MVEILKTTHLSKYYQQTKVLDDIHMTIHKGEIYGFIGQNGAGKSTTIRMITGLGAPSTGEVYLFGEQTKHLEKAQKRIGLLLEGPSLYEHLTALENLEVQRRLLGIPEKNRLTKILELVDLANIGNKKVKNFSLGMKQRLGVALALLNEPELLILDEPTNGLDPMGIVELRQLLQRLNREQEITILISSHILRELELLATTYGFIHQGKLLQEISAEHLKEEYGQYLEIEVDNLELGTRVLKEILGTSNFKVYEHKSIRLYDYVDQKQLVSKTLTKEGLIIEKFVQVTGTLEAYFARLIGGEIHE
jgi:ABC-2 type transport system ATP-binding protein